MGVAGLHATAHSLGARMKMFYYGKHTETPRRHLVRGDSHGFPWGMQKLSQSTVPGYHGRALARVGAANARTGLAAQLKPWPPGGE